MANVYVQPFPPTGARERISATIGLSPRWSADGRKLFYMTADDRMMVTEVSIPGTAFRVGLPRELFTQRTPGQRALDTDADGKRFLLVAGRNSWPPRTRRIRSRSS